MSSLSTDQIACFKQQLLEQKQELLALVESTSQASEAVELDQTRQGRLSRMDALQGQAMSKAMLERRQSRLTQIDKALKRIEENDYGVCLSCEEEITPQRLDYDPAVALCIKCAE